MQNTTWIHTPSCWKRKNGDKRVEENWITNGNLKGSKSKKFFRKNWLSNELWYMSWRTKTKAFCVLIVFLVWEWSTVAIKTGNYQGNVFFFLTIPKLKWTKWTQGDRLFFEAIFCLWIFSFGTQIQLLLRVYRKQLRDHIYTTYKVYPVIDSHHLYEKFFCLTSVLFYNKHINKNIIFL